MIESILASIFTEYGAFTTFLILTIGLMVHTVKKLFDHVKTLETVIIEIIPKNTAIITKLVEKLEGGSHDRDSD